MLYYDIRRSCVFKWSVHFAALFATISTTAGRRRSLFSGGNVFPCRHALFAAVASNICRLPFFKNGSRRQNRVVDLRPRRKRREQNHGSDETGDFQHWIVLLPISPSCFQYTPNPGLNRDVSLDCQYCVRSRAGHTGGKGRGASPPFFLVRYMPGNLLTTNFLVLYWCQNICWQWICW